MQLINKKDDAKLPAKKIKEIAKSSKNDKKTLEKSTDRKTPFDVHIKKVNGVDIMNYETTPDAMLKTTGFKCKYASSKIFNRTVEGLITGGLSHETIEGKIAQLFLVMSELKPMDGFEGMLISQMVTVYDQAMDCFKYVNINKSNPEACQRLQNQAIKLMRLYNQQLETLDKHRRKGNQKMTVEHVNVHKGGQAIVGNVTQGERG